MNHPKDFYLRTHKKEFYDYECALYLTDKHFLRNPIQLDCRHCVCKKCIIDNKPIKCVFCGRVTKSDLTDATESMIKREEIQNNLKELLSETKERLKKSCDELKGIIKSIKLYCIICFILEELKCRDDTIKDKFIKIESKVIERVEFLKKELDQHLSYFKNDLSIIQEQMTE